MTETEVRLCESETDLAATFVVMTQLRPHIEQTAYLSALNEVIDDGGQMISAIEGGEVVGCAVFRRQIRLALGTIIYVDDLVTDEKRRSAGIGAHLLSWIENEARRCGATEVVLDSGCQRVAAHRFYFRQGFAIRSFNFRKSV